VLTQAADRSELNNKKSGGYPLFGAIRLVQPLVYHFPAARATAMVRWLARDKQFQLGYLALGSWLGQGSWCPPVEQAHLS